LTKTKLLLEHLMIQSRLLHIIRLSAGSQQRAEENLKILRVSEPEHVELLQMVSNKLKDGLSLPNLRRYLLPQDSCQISYYMTLPILLTVINQFETPQSQMLIDWLENLKILLNQVSHMCSHCVSHVHSMLIKTAIIVCDGQSVAPLKISQRDIICIHSGPNLLERLLKPIDCCGVQKAWTMIQIHFGLETLTHQCICIGRQDTVQEVAEFCKTLPIQDTIKNKPPPNSKTYGQDIHSQKNAFAEQIIKRCSNCNISHPGGGWKMKKWTIKTFNGVSFILCRKCYCMSIPSRGGQIHIIHGKLKIVKSRRTHRGMKAIS
jgi:hypothetical protein